MEAPATTPQYSLAQYIPILVASFLSSSLSLLGSSFIIYMMIQQQSLKTKILHRLLLGISVGDFVASVSALLMPYLIPQEVSNNLPGAIGNHASCSAAGFLFMTCLGGGSCYNAGLSVYYLLVVRYGWKERDFPRKIELGGHVLAFSYPLALNIAALATQSINPAAIINNVCTYAGTPYGCGLTDTCERGDIPTMRKTLLLLAAWVLLWSVLSFVCAVLVWDKVRGVIQRSASHRFEGGMDESSAGKLREVGTQCLLYTSAYFNTVLWPMVALVLSFVQPGDDKKTEPGYYALCLLFWLFCPLQGALNFFTFTRLPVQQWRKAAPDRSLFYIYKQVLRSNRPPRRGSQSCYHTVRKNSNDGSGDQMVAPFPRQESSAQEDDDDGLIE